MMPKSDFNDIDQPLWCDYILLKFKFERNVIWKCLDFAGKQLSIDWVPMEWWLNQECSCRHVGTIWISKTSGRSSQSIRRQGQLAVSGQQEDFWHHHGENVSKSIEYMQSGRVTNCKNMPISNWALELWFCDFGSRISFFKLSEIKPRPDTL